MKVPTLCRGLQVTWLTCPLDSRDAGALQLLFTATQEWTYRPHTHRLPASGRLCGPSKVEGTSGKTQHLCIWAFALNYTQKDHSSHLCRHPQSALKFQANPGPTSKNRLTRNRRLENIVQVLIKLSVSVPLNPYLKLSTREFHTPGCFILGKTTVGAHSREWCGKKQPSLFFIASNVLKQQA